MSRDNPWTCPICGNQPCSCLPEGAKALPTLACRCGRAMAPVQMRWLPGTPDQERAGRIRPIVCSRCARKAATLLKRWAGALGRDAVGVATTVAVVVGLGWLYELAPLVAR